MTEPDDLFVGWRAQAPPRDRRFLLMAGLGLVGLGAAAAAGLARRGPDPGPGRWDQAALRRYAGVLVQAPYPTLLTRTADGAIRPSLLVGYDKTALPRRGGGPASVELEASAITRGAQAMLAVKDRAAWMRLRHGAPAFAPPPEEDLGPVARLGEILDAKCWFGAMKPGYGLTHKACAAVCARGRLPLAFCAVGECQGEEEVCLFLDQDGRPHGPDIIPWLADPVFAAGRLHRRHGLLEFRVAREGLRRV